MCVAFQLTHSSNHRDLIVVDYIRMSRNKHQSRSDYYNKSARRHNHHQHSIDRLLLLVVFALSALLLNSQHPFSSSLLCLSSARARTPLLLLMMMMMLASHPANPDFDAQSNSSSSKGEEEKTHASEYRPLLRYMSISFDIGHIPGLDTNMKLRHNYNYGR